MALPLPAEPSALHLEPLLKLALAWSMSTARLSVERRRVTRLPSRRATCTHSLQATQRAYRMDSSRGPQMLTRLPPRWLAWAARAALERPAQRQMWKLQRVRLETSPETGLLKVTSTAAPPLRPCKGCCMMPSTALASPRELLPEMSAPWPTPSAKALWLKFTTRRSTLSSTMASPLVPEDPRHQTLEEMTNLVLLWRPVRVPPFHLPPIRT
mmetsp:Transcript_945/g.2094  ORF Transcript_945/g.2094 Transcript_945/m.2094 type:complete len:212 (+) Transcript_945:1088-1723(+)